MVVAAGLVRSVKSAMRSVYAIPTALQVVSVKTVATMDAVAPVALVRSARCVMHLEHAIAAALRIVLAKNVAPMAVVVSAGTARLARLAVRLGCASPYVLLRVPVKAAAMMVVVVAAALVVQAKHVNRVFVVRRAHATGKSVATTDVEERAEVAVQDSFVSRAHVLMPVLVHRIVSARYVVRTAAVAPVVRARPRRHAQKRRANVSIQRANQIVRVKSAVQMAAVMCVGNVQRAVYARKSMCARAALVLVQTQPTAPMEL